jgi:hypothetical protein
VKHFSDMAGQDIIYIYIYTYIYSVSDSNDTNLSLVAQSVSKKPLDRASLKATLRSATSTHFLDEKGRPGQAIGSDFNE